MINFLELPQVKINTEAFGIVIAGGRKPSDAWLKEIAIGKEIYCADKGIEVALSNNLLPEILLGDCDSTEKIFYDKAQALGVEISLHPSAKDDTDLQLLLKNLPKQNYLFTGIWGGRFDHLYANVFSLLNFKLQGQKQVVMADEKEVMLLVCASEEYKIKLNVQPKAVSLLPLSDKASVSIKNVRWELENSNLSMLNPYAISNEALEDEILFQCLQGCVGLYILFD
ncbi:MAG: thiamine diphosphokinase [Phascolarctobacterium sp.]|nr:thiamine diphosphokinase [Phascolarctobacterium sp.]